VSNLQCPVVWFHQEWRDHSTQSSISSNHRIITKRRFGIVSHCSTVGGCFNQPSPLLRCRRITRSTTLSLIETQTLNGANSSRFQHLSGWFMVQSNQAKTWRDWIAYSHNSFLFVQRNFRSSIFAEVNSNYCISFRTFSIIHFHFVRLWRSGAWNVPGLLPWPYVVFIIS